MNIPLEYDSGNYYYRKQLLVTKEQRMASKTSVLYVDDEESLRMLVKNQLSSEGFTVDVADDGDTAIDVLKAKKFDVILLDVRMPRVGGIEVLKYVKENKIASRVIMLTAVDDLTVAIESVKQGAVDYLTKPYDLDTLLSAINRVSAK
jgi:DNA-binding NtrC family response regulator